MVKESVQNILGMEPNVDAKYKWLTYALSAPFHIFRTVPKTKLYIVEADCDRPHEGEFIGKFIKPEVTLVFLVYYRLLYRLFQKLSVAAHL